MAMTEQSISKVAIIGAGVSGLCATRRLLDAGLDVVIFERRLRPGGIWISTLADASIGLTEELEAKIRRETILSTLQVSESSGNKRSPVTYQWGPAYDSLTVINAVPQIEFPGFPFPEGTPRFIPCKIAGAYLQEFSETIGYRNVARHGVEVTKVEKHPGGRWRVWHTENHQGPPEQFDAVVVCTGQFDQPYIPSILGIAEWTSKWPDRLLHSKLYRNAQEFVDKTIVIVGGGTSALEIGRELSLVARRLYQSSKNISRPNNKDAGTPLPWKRVTQSVKPADIVQVAEIESFGSVISIDRIRKAELILTDGKILNGIDYVIFCTGYSFHLPFLDDYNAVNNVVGHSETAIISDGQQLFNLYKDIFYIPDPTLNFIGVPLGVAHFPFADIQAFAVATYLSGKAKLPDRVRMRQAERAQAAAGTQKKKIHKLGPPDRDLRYVDDLMSWTGSELGISLAERYRRLTYEAQTDQVADLRARLELTPILQGKSEAEKTAIVAAKVRELEQSLSVSGA